jgi:hypothetical protein
MRECSASGKGALNAESVRRNLSAIRARCHIRCIARSGRNGQGPRLEFSVPETENVETSFDCAAAMTNGLFAHGFGRLEWSARRLHCLRAGLEQHGVVKAAASSKFLETATAIGRDDSGGAQAAGRGPRK